MSFGAPGGRAIATKPTPPERGSFPLDHDGTISPGDEATASSQYMEEHSLKQVSIGECKDVMTSYLACMKKVKGMNDPECRNFAKAYLTCRMDRNLMAKDEFKNLGFADDKKPPDKKDEDEKDKPGELRW